MLLWAIQTILKLISTPTVKTCEEDIFSESSEALSVRQRNKARTCHDINLSPVIANTNQTVTLSQKAFDELAHCRPLSNEVLGAYLNLLATQRCFKEFLDEREVRYHFFDAMFYEMLVSMRSRGVKQENYILQLSSFLNKHYLSPKKVSKNSVFIFLVPLNLSNEFILVRAEPSRRRFVVYDPRAGRKAKVSFWKQINTIRPFLADYLENFTQRSYDEDLDVLGSDSIKQNGLAYQKKAVLDKEVL